MAIDLIQSRKQHLRELKGDQIELERTAGLVSDADYEKGGSGTPAVGPPPDGSDPSINASWRRRPNAAIVLHRVQR